MSAVGTGLVPLGPPAVTPEQVAGIVAMFGDGAAVEVVAERQEVARFGASRIVYQHGEERVRVRIGCRRDGRSGWALAETLDPVVLREMRDRLHRTLSVLPTQAPVVLADAGPVPTASGTWFPAVTGPDARLGWFNAVRAGLGAGTDVGGSATQSVIDHLVADSSGLARAERRTRAALAVVAERGGRSSYGKAVHRDPAAIDAVALAGQVAAGLSVPDGRIDLAERPRVLLGPQAVATLLATFGYIACGAADLSSGASPLSGRIGQQVLAPELTITDDATDPAGLPTGFDCEGGTKSPVLLVDRGVAVGRVHDRATAAAAGSGTTGHAVPPGWRFGTGPAVSHLLLDTGSASDRDLLDALGDGVWVQRVDYVRVLQPRQALVTGTSRDATLAVRGGRVVGLAPQIRFTVRLDELFASVLAVGSRRERSETVFAESVVAPAVVLPGIGDVEPTGR